MQYSCMHLYKFIFIYFYIYIHSLRKVLSTRGDPECLAASSFFFLSSKLSTARQITSMQTNLIAIHQTKKKLHYCSNNISKNAYDLSHLCCMHRVMLHLQFQLLAIWFDSPGSIDLQNVKYRLGFEL